MLNLDPAKLLVIALIALVVLGPERLPKVARQLGGAWRELTRLRQQVTDEVKTAFPLDDLPSMPNVSSSISNAVSSITRPLQSTVAGATAPSTSTTAANDGEAESTDGGPTPPRPPAGNSAATRQAPEVVVHGSLGEFAFLPDDPNMN